MGTLMAFESQVETPEAARSSALNANDKNSIVPLLARRSSGFIEGFGRIEKALMPQSRVR